jgi:hypothetical protein
MKSVRWWFGLGMALSGLVFSCSKSEKSGDHGAPPPPPVETARRGACASGGGQVADPVSAPFFPRTVGEYCLDPQGETRTYGDQGKLDMDAVCTTAFDGECTVYAQFGLKRLVALRFIDGGGGAGTVEVYLSRFADALGAYGMFTKRVVADSDPAEPTTPKPLEAGGAGALGTGRAYVWKGVYLAELQYNNEDETPAALAVSSAKILSAVAKDMGARLPGGSDKPAAAERLPKEHLVPNGIQFFPKDAPGLGSAAAAVGFYKDGAKRYRVTAVVRDDLDRAKETLKGVRSRPGWLPVPALGDEALVTTLPGPAKDELVIARQGRELLGVSDETFAQKPGEDSAGGSAARLSREEKVARLRKWLAAAASPDGKAR